MSLVNRWLTGVGGCAIFATAQTFFVMAIVYHEFSVPVSRGYHDIGGVMNSLIMKRSVVLAGHKTSISLEDAFWESLKKIASDRGLRMSTLLAMIDSDRNYNNLSSNIRLFVLNYYRDQFDRQETSPIATRESPALSPVH
jgi:predicted DNA-binding ribbon-helix-helix protein